MNIHTRRSLKTSLCNIPFTTCLFIPLYTPVSGITEDQFITAVTGRSLQLQTFTEFKAKQQFELTEAVPVGTISITSWTVF